MRILALHGVGSSAKILESQLVGLMRSVDASYEFVLVDGPVPSHRGPGKPDNAPPQTETAVKRDLPTDARPQA